MTEKKDGEITLREISEKLDSIFEGMYKNIKVYSEVQTNFISTVTKWMDDRRKEDAQRDKKFQTVLNYQSIVIGFTLGTLGNLFVSYLMKVLEPLAITWEAWLMSALTCLALSFLMVFILKWQIGETKS